jgi:predicted flap endonuclease-1-like 5' DNA nuclease
VIEGIGPKIAGVLNVAGIWTFRQLAALSPDSISQILGQADARLLRLADPTTWPEQARLAAAGNMDELQRLQDSLKGGRQA